MKSDRLRIALEMLKGSVSTETDAVDLTGTTVRATDGLWWAEATLPDPFLTPMILSYSKLRSIVRTLDEKDDVEIEPNGSTCLIKVPPTSWLLNLLNVPIEPPPEFQAIKTIEASGSTLLEAYQSLKHIIRTDLSRPGLMWAWTNADLELVIGDGSRLAGHQTGIKGLELPLTTLKEICRILAVHPSEKATLQIGENYIHAAMQDSQFQAILPTGARFEPDWYHKVKNLLNEYPQVINTSRSDLLHAINQVRPTAGESMINLFQGNGGLILMTKDEYGDTSVIKIHASGELKDSISLNINHLGSAIEVLSNESIVMKVVNSAVEVSDEKGWEIIART